MFMTYTICRVFFDEATGNVEVKLSKPLARKNSEMVSVCFRLSPLDTESRDSFEARARRAAKKVLEDALLSI